MKLAFVGADAAARGGSARVRFGAGQVRATPSHLDTPAADRQWLTAVLDRISHDFGSRVDLPPDGMLALPGASLSGTVGKMRSRSDARAWDCRSRSRVPALGCL